MLQQLKTIGRGWALAGPALAVLATLAVLAQVCGGRALAAEPEGDKKAVVLETVKVTAEKTSQDVQDVPASISVVTGTQLEDMNVTDSYKLFQMTPNMYLVKMASKAGPTGFASVRGITSFMTGSPVLGFYVDDVYYTNMEMNLFDIERAEVLRGPQGTLYGRNTEAGVINIVTRKPGNQWTGKVQTGYGSYGAKDFSGVLGGPLAEDLLTFRLAGRYSVSDGFNKNNAKGGSDVGGPEDGDARMSFDYTPSSDWSFQWTTDAQNYRSKYADFQTLASLKDNPNRVNVDYNGQAQRNAYGTSLKAEHDLGGMKLVSITAARDERNRGVNDVDFTALDFMRLETVTQSKLLSEELRLSSEGAGPAKWLAGLYAFNEDALMKAKMDIRPLSMDFVQKGTTKTLGTAAFGQYSYTLADRLTLTGGLRYDREQKDFRYQWTGGAVWGLLGGTAVADQSGTASKTFNAWLPKFVADYKWAEDLNTYASISRGFKSGGFNVKDTPGKAYDAEYTWNYELGLKSQWFDKRLQFNASAFYIKWDKQQVEVPNYPDFTIINAEHSTSKGLEFELRALPLSALELTGSFGYVYSVLDEMRSGGVDYSGSRAPNSPGYTASLGATYRFQDGFLASLLYNRYGERYLSLGNSQKQGEYQTVDLKLGYEKEGFEASLWAKNVFDAAYATRTFESGGIWYARAGDPRTVGLSLAYNF